MAMRWLIARFARLEEMGELGKMVDRPDVASGLDRVGRNGGNGNEV